VKVVALELEGLKKIELKLHGDARGFFVERFQKQRFRDAGLPFEFVQDNHSRSSPGIVRGLHFQTAPAQGKLVGVVRGRIWDVAVDLRAQSPTFGRHLAVELSDVEGTMLWIPPGFAHGFCVLGSEPADVVYKVDAVYTPSTESGVRWDDPELGIPWPIKNPQVSARDAAMPMLSEFKRNPARFIR
jgi:dTDP-4-dehydrorhamnose 3,5-epimerase